MPIPNSQFETWSQAQNPIVLKQTLDITSNLLKGFKQKLPYGKTIEDPYLQGSYANKTNIYGKGDIDIVIEFNSSSRSNVLNRPGYFKPTFGYSEFRVELFDFLKQTFGEHRVSEGKKTFKIDEDSEIGRKSVDIVPCVTYHHYLNGFGSNKIDGISLYDKENKCWINNFPKIHKQNGESKDYLSNGLFKKYVRIFKNIRKQLDEDDKTFPSYFIECLIYNIPNNLLLKDHYSGFISILSYILDDFNQLEELICQNHVDKLIGTKSTQWNRSSLIKFISGCLELNENWNL